MEQAAKISGWIHSSVDSPKYRVCFINNSNKPIYEVIVIGIRFYDKNTSSLENVCRDRFKIFAQIPAGKGSCILTLSSGMNKSFGVEITFTDSNGLR